MKITINKHECIGCGSCVSVASGTFDFDSDGKAKVLEKITDDQETIQSGIDSCPVNAIKKEE
ncbi:MAG: ferredoxin [Patescibacteria group bacterium]